METQQLAYANLTFKGFKDEYRLICSDTWGNAMEAWFECAGQMNKRGMPIPPEWNYRPGMGSDGTDEESYWNEIFEGITDEMLVRIGQFMTRYCQFLKFKGVDY